MIAKALRNAHPRRARVAARIDRTTENGTLPAERQLLLAHRLAVFDGCVVYDAQPPVSAEHVQRLAEGLAGPIPDLLRLWRTCFGGASAMTWKSTDGHRHPFSFSELFYPDSDGYHDLWGWIEHGAAAEAAAEGDWNGKLAYPAVPNTWSGSTSASNPAPSMAR